MKQRLFWGTPHTDTDVAAFEAALRERAEDVAAGRFAAVEAVDRALEQISRRSIGLLQFDALLALVMMMLAYKVGTAAPELFSQLNRWGFALALVSCVLLLPNLALAWAGSPGTVYRNPHEAYAFSMTIHKMRAARYTFALIFTFIAALLTVVSLTRLA